MLILVNDVTDTLYVGKGSIKELNHFKPWELYIVLKRKVYIMRKSKLSCNPQLVITLFPDTRSCLVKVCFKGHWLWFKMQCYWITSSVCMYSKHLKLNSYHEAFRCHPAAFFSSKKLFLWFSKVYFFEVKLVTEVFY